MTIVIGPALVVFGAATFLEHRLGSCVRGGLALGGVLMILVASMALSPTRSTDLVPPSSSP